MEMLNKKKAISPIPLILQGNAIIMGNKQDTPLPLAYMLYTPPMEPIKFHPGQEFQYIRYIVKFT